MKRTRHDEAHRTTEAADEQVLQPRRGRPESYPWARWMDGRIHTVRHGKQFDSKPKSFARIVQRRAERDGRTVVVRIEGKSVVKFQFNKPSEPESAKGS